MTPDILRELDHLDTLSGQMISLCMQCGVCSASCPNVLEMDLTPRALMHQAQLGRLDQVLSGKTIWVCSSCLQCSVRCPRGIDLARVMEAFRLVKLRKREGMLDPADINPACSDAPPILLVAAMRKLTG